MSKPELLARPKRSIKDLCICSHWKDEHNETFFGIECTGKDWQDDQQTKKQCSCKEFRTRG